MSQSLAMVSWGLRGSADLIRAYMIHLAQEGVHGLVTSKCFEQRNADSLHSISECLMHACYTILRYAEM